MRYEIEYKINQMFLSVTLTIVLKLINQCLLSQIFKYFKL